MNEIRKLIETIEQINEENEYETFSVKFYYDREGDPYNINWELLDDKGEFQGSGSDSIEDMPNVFSRLILPQPPEDSEDGFKLPPI